MSVDVVRVERATTVAAPANHGSGLSMKLEFQSNLNLYSNITDPLLSPQPTCSTQLSATHDQHDVVAKRHLTRAHVNCVASSARSSLCGGSSWWSGCVRSTATNKRIGNCPGCSSTEEDIWRLERSGPHLPELVQPPRPRSRQREEVR
jgi:hypothetical protein